MGQLAVLALRVVLGMLLAGAAVVQGMIVPLLAADLEGLPPEVAYLRIPIVLIFFLGVVAAEVVIVCVWRLVTMVRRGTVFSPAAFRYVHIVIGAFVAAAVLVFALAAFLASANHRVQEDFVAPGIVLIICGVSVGLLGVALIVLVLRMLLAQAIALDVEAERMRAELDGVI
jgi:hypothetical protein|nr:MAG: DUF2975 domain-containing protein [Actinomycetota bacterium]